jgi:predicted small lipoprotein YifL
MNRTGLLRPCDRRGALRALLTLALAAGGAGILAACGKRGDLELSPGKKAQYPRTYPEPSSYDK